VPSAPAGTPRSAASGRVGEGGRALLEVGPDGLDLVGAAAQGAESPRLFEELTGEVVVRRAVQQPFGAPYRVGAVAGDLAGEFAGGSARVVGGAGGEADPGGLLTGQHAAGERELLCDVLADEADQGGGAGHVRDEPPADLQHRQLRIGRDDADVGAERDLQAAAERVPVDGGDDGLRHLPPDVHRLLPEVGDASRLAVRDVVQQPLRPLTVTGALPVAGHGGEPGEVEPRAEGTSLTRQDDGPDGRVRRQRVTRLGERVERGHVEGVQLVGPVEPHIGDPFVHFHGDAVGHPGLPLRRGDHLKGDDSMRYRSQSRDPSPRTPLEGALTGQAGWRRRAEPGCSQAESIPPLPRPDVR
jgi:hypothetical protein